MRPHLCRKARQKDGFPTSCKCSCMQPLGTVVRSSLTLSRQTPHRVELDQLVLFNFCLTSQKYNLHHWHPPCAERKETSHSAYCYAVKQLICVPSKTLVQRSYPSDRKPETEPCLAHQGPAQSAVVGSADMTQGAGSAFKMGGRKLRVRCLCSPRKPFCMAVMPLPALCLGPLHPYL